MRAGPRQATLAVVLAIIAAAIGLLWPTVTSLARRWSERDPPTYAHGWLVVAISAWLIARSARQVSGAPAPDWRLAILLSICSLFWLIAYRAGLEIVHQLMLPVLLFMAFSAALGFSSARRFAFACAYLYFSMSIWDIATGPLQAISVRAVKLMLAVAGVPAFVDGNFVNIPEGTFEVEGGCSGLQFFMVALALGALSGEIHRDRWPRRLSQVALAAAFAMVANWVRIFVVIVAGHATDMQHYLVQVDHYYFGWAVFAVAMAGFFWIESRRAADGISDAASVVSGPPRPLAAIAVGVIGLALGPLISLASPLRPAPAHTLSLPRVEGWAGPSTAAEDSAMQWAPSYPRADRQWLAGYADGDAWVQAFVAEYDDQHQDKELIGYDNSLREGLDLQLHDSRDLSSNRGPIRVLRLADAQGQRSLLAFYFAIGERRLVSGISAQLRYATASLAGPVSSRVVAVRARCARDCEELEHRLLKLLDAIDEPRKAT